MYFVLYTESFSLRVCIRMLWFIFLNLVKAVYVLNVFYDFLFKIQFCHEANSVRVCHVYLKPEILSLITEILIKKIEPEQANNVNYLPFNVVFFIIGRITLWPEN